MYFYVHTFVTSPGINPKLRLVLTCGIIMSATAQTGSTHRKTNTNISLKEDVWHIVCNIPCVMCIGMEKYKVKLFNPMISGSHMWPEYASQQYQSPYALVLLSNLFPGFGKVHEPAVIP